MQSSPVPAHSPRIVAQGAKFMVVRMQRPTPCFLVGLPLRWAWRKVQWRLCIYKRIGDT